MLASVLTQQTARIGLDPHSAVVCLSLVRQLLQHHPPAALYSRHSQHQQPACAPAGLQQQHQTWAWPTSSSSSSTRHQLWQDQQFTTRSYSTGDTNSTTTTTSSSSEPPKNLKGSLPRSGPSHKTLRALPFTVSRAAAAEAFAAYHGRHWYQSRQRPLLAKAFKETFLPFWVGSGVVRVEVSGAEVGHEHLVTR